MRKCFKCGHMNKDGIRFCEKRGINMDFKTSEYNNELNKNEEEI